jgi:UDP-N-acetylenolpyruvoylglucosamine reductase
MNISDTLAELSNKIGGQVKLDEPLNLHTTIKIGGLAQFFYEAKTRADLVKSVIVARELKIPYFILGGGTNILISDTGLPGLTIKNNTRNIKLKGIKGELTEGVSHGKVYLDVDSGVIFNQLVRYSVDQGWSGLQMHLGLPGTVGGAIFMNSKWTKPISYVGDVVYQAELLDPDNQVKSVLHDYFNFDYDYSVVQDTKDIILGVTFLLEQENKTDLWEIANQSITHRRNTQPQGVFTAGCTFKNLKLAQALVLNTPDHTTSAGYLIDHAGLKGYTIGDAQVSTHHANFIINLGHAKAHDVIELITLVKAKVKQQFKVDLEEEIIKIGEF